MTENGEGEERAHRPLGTENVDMSTCGTNQVDGEEGGIIDTTCRWRRSASSSLRCNGPLTTIHDLRLTTAGINLRIEQRRRGKTGPSSSVLR